MCAALNALHLEPKWHHFSFRHYICLYDSTCAFRHEEQTFLSCGLPSNPNREAQYIKVSHKVSLDSMPTVHVIHNHSPSSRKQGKLTLSRKKTIANNLLCELGSRVEGVCKKLAEEHLCQGGSPLLNRSAHVVVFGGDFNCDEADWTHFFKAKSTRWSPNPFQILKESVRVCESKPDPLHGDTAVVFNADVIKTTSTYGHTFKGFSDAHDAVLVSIVLRKPRSLLTLSAFQDKMASRRKWTDEQCVVSYAEQSVDQPSASAQYTSHQHHVQPLDRSSACVLNRYLPTHKVGCESDECAAVQPACRATTKIDQVHLNPATQEKISERNHVEYYAAQHVEAGTDTQQARKLCTANSNFDDSLLQAFFSSQCVVRPPCRTPGDHLAELADHDDRKALVVPAVQHGQHVNEESEESEDVDKPRLSDEDIREASDDDDAQHDDHLHEENAGNENDQAATSDSSFSKDDSNKDLHYVWNHLDDINDEEDDEEDRDSNEEEGETTEEENDDHHNATATTTIFDRNDDDLWGAFLAAAALASTEASNDQRELAESIRQLTNRFLHAPDDPKGTLSKSMWIDDETGYVKLVPPPRLAPAHKFQHLLKVTRLRYENAIRHRRCRIARCSTSLTDDEREEEMTRWQGAFHDWSDKPQKLSRGANKHVRSAFEVYKMQLCGNKDLVHMLVQYPLHKSVNPVRWITSFLSTQNTIHSSPDYRQAVEQSKILTPERSDLKIAARRLRRQYTHAQYIHKALQKNWTWRAWGDLADYERQLWHMFKSGELENKVAEADAKTGHSRLTHARRRPKRSFVSHQLQHI
jgi:hypothetical protein